jgi:Zn-dependent M16 (insulinase) family peptidase
LEEAQGENDKPLPPDDIRKFKVPKIDNIKFIETTNAVYRRASSPSDGARNEIEKFLDKDAADLPYNLVFSHTTTQFVTLTLWITTKDIPWHLRPYIQPYLDSFFALPITRNGVIVDFEEVVKEINSLTVSTKATLGSKKITEAITISIRGEKSLYHELVRLLRELLTSSVFDPERLSIEVSKAQNDIPSVKRDGFAMAKEFRDMIQLDEQTSSTRAVSTLRQESFLEEIEKGLEENETDVVTRFQELRAECSFCFIPGLIVVTKVERLRVNVIADVLTLEHPVSVWNDFLPPQKVLQISVLY